MATCRNSSVGFKIAAHCARIYNCALAEYLLKKGKVLEIIKLDDWECT